MSLTYILFDDWPKESYQRADCTREANAAGIQMGQGSIQAVIGDVPTRFAIEAYSDFKVPIHASGQVLNGSHSMGHGL